MLVEGIFDRAFSFPNFRGESFVFRKRRLVHGKVFFLRGGAPHHFRFPPLPPSFSMITLYPIPLSGSQTCFVFVIGE